ncbi:MAG TPA: c-type cytochrome biogenesis protein CcsB [Dehalococcoidia bacterium]|nr:c-type cytochrome biogenesis protein CcsB [Dehalococcoidia bacterium]
MAHPAPKRHHVGVTPPSEGAAPLESLAYNTFIVSYVLAFGGAALYLALPLWPRVSYRAAETTAGTSMTIASRSEPPAWLAPAATATSWLMLATLTLSLAFRWIATEHPPYANMYEYTIALGWGSTLFYVIFERAFGQRSLGAVLFPGIAALFTVSLVFFPTEVTALIPALQANRILGIHVGMMMMSYSALSVSFGAAVLYFVQDGKRRFARLPSAARLEEIAHTSVLVGFPMLALGIALGAWWANDAWGRYWGWDPKETSALVTWLIYAGYLHARGLRGWRGKRSAAILIAGYAAVLFTYFAVNLWVSGLHSYAGV